jgi:serine/threonine protein kinase
MNCFSVKGQYEVCPFCGYVEGTPPRQPHYLTPGTILGNRFIVGTVIGVGGFGITYKCFDTTLGVVVAVKEFYPAGLVNRAPGERRVGLLSGEKSGQYQERLERFLLEAQSVAQFGKANDIVNVFDFFEENGTAYIIMEYIDGVLLKDYLDKQGVIEPEAAMSIIMPIIEAVKKIHSKGIIHRDISPDNIFIASEKSIKIFDFGAAQLNNSKEGMAAEPVIKVGYSPLEQYRDNSRQGFYTDVYAVGAILYQMLTGVKPIESTEREFHDDLKSPRELGVKISGNMDRAVMEALGVRPELRFQGIQQFQDALLNKRIAEYPKEKIRKRKRTRNWIISLSAVAALAVVVGIGLYSTVLKPNNQIFDSTVKDGTEITVWVENEDQKNWVKALEESGFRKGNSSTSDSRVEAMQKDDEKVTVNVEVKEDMETALKEASADDSIALPNMFLSDHVSNLSDYRLVSMEDNVYASLSNLDDYLYMSEYAGQYTDMKEMPTGIDTLLLYACSIDYNKDNKVNESAYYSLDSDTQTVELSQLISGEGDDYTTADGYLNENLAYISTDALPGVLQLSDSTAWNKVFQGKIQPDSDMENLLVKIQGYSKVATKKKYKVNAEKGLYGSNILAGAAFRSKLKQDDETSDTSKETGANPLKDYKTYVVTENEKMLVRYSECFAITAESSEDQEIACMRLLWVMLSEGGQNKKASLTGETTYPIRKKSFEKFTDCNSKFAGFLEMVSDKSSCVLLNGEAQRNGAAFATGLADSKATDFNGIQSYCEAYQAE